MATRKQQKIRSQKREKRSKNKARSNRRSSSREPIHILVERAADALRTHPALAGARFDREMLRAELVLLDDWAARQIALADGLERLAGYMFSAL